ncbi:ubiquitin fusion degradation protein [Rhizophlyctis rosea]|nr:ubiquitin fusion degradation protein [Rhizophlyctis rosea]
MFGGFDYYGGGRRGVPGNTYEAHFRAYSIAFMSNGDGREELNYGGKIIMPTSALEILSQLNIEYPMLFEIFNHTQQDKSAFAGVLEFIAEEGRCYLPRWLMESLSLEEGGLIRIKNTSLPLGQFVKLQAQSVKFLEITDPRAVLERSLRQYSALTQGSIIEIKYNKAVYQLLIMEIKPSNQKGISVIETDIEVDFAAPVGYVEPKAMPRSYAPQLAGSSMSIEEHKVAEAEKFAPFQGSGQKLKGGDTSSSSPASAFTDTTKLSAQSGKPGVPEALRLPPGKLFFGYPIVPLKKRENEGVANGASSLQAFSGAGQTLKAPRKGGAGGGSGSSSASDLSKGGPSGSQDKRKR